MRGAVLLAAALLLVACTEKPQTAGTRKTDDKAWAGAADPYVAPGWKPGDETSWNEHVKQRAQGQNEYSRTGAAP